MRQAFVERTEEIKALADAETVMPWACMVVVVDGGYRGFESAEDFGIWMAQS